jgi:hypothetical protein
MTPALVCALGWDAGAVPGPAVFPLKDERSDALAIPVAECAVASLDERISCLAEIAGHGHIRSPGRIVQGEGQRDFH